MAEPDIVKKLLERLRQQLNAKSSNQCQDTVEILSEYFDGSITSSQTNYALELMLKWNDQKISILRFLAKSIHWSKSDKFKDCNKKIFELIQNLTQRHPKQLKLYSRDIVSACTIYIQSNLVSAFEKECAVVVIQELLLKDALGDDIDFGKLITDLMTVFYQKNPPARLQQHTYELLGVLSKNHPDNFNPTNAKDLRNKMLNTIQSVFKDDKATTSLVLVSGVVEGLRNHLVNFTPKADDETELTFSEKLYECMVQLTDPDKISNHTSTSKVAYRNMLLLVQQYGSLFDIPFMMYQDYKLWHKNLNKWINEPAYDNKIAGIRAIHTFHQQIANFLEATRDEDDKRVLMFFMVHFQDTLESASSEPHEIGIAIRGFGLMAAACKILLEPKYLSQHFDLVMQRTEYSYHTKDRLKRREVLEHLPDYVESLSKIMNQLDEISGIQLQSLETIVVILIKDFHFLSSSRHQVVATCLLETFLNLQKQGEEANVQFFSRKLIVLSSGGNILDRVMETVIWQGILWTCSHQLPFDLQENITNVNDWKETITYKKYLPLWKRILSPEIPKYQEISKMIYSFFMKDLFLIIEKLDLSTRKRKFYDETIDEDKEFFFSDPSLDLEPVRAENFQILYNLAQFYQEVILLQAEECLRSNFVEWLEDWLDKSIQLANKHPLVSGFLQLIEIALKVINRLNFVNENDNESIKTVEPLGFFVKSMLFARCRLMSGELQIGCLQVIFQVPTLILKNFVEELTPILIIGFSVGQSLLSIAHGALTCFEKVVELLSEDTEIRRNLLEKVMPCLEVYLSSRDGGETSVKQFKRGRKHNHLIVHTSAVTDLMRMKKRIFLFLGQFDPEESQMVLASYEQKLVRDHVTNIFKIKLECDESETPLIFLDDVISRICQLALSSSERAIKISSCELLHGVVLYMMGKNLDGSETLPLWKDLCINLIILGADKDTTVRQLFEPLLMQMMHFFAQPSKILSPMATALVEVLLTTICYKGNCGVQDLTARLLREFFLWLNKTSDRQQRLSLPIKLVDFFREMRKMSTETDPSRRTGATLAFNNIYRIVREDDDLIDIYWIYLLDIFSCNFKSSEDFSSEFDNNFINGQRFEQVSSSMDHLARVFVERSEIFHRLHDNRITPDGFEGSTLPDVLKWLFQESGRREYHYRHKCMEMFIKILPECGTKQEFFEANLSIDQILSIGEQNGIAKHPDLEHLRQCEEPIFKEVSKWLHSFLTSLDFYIWIFQNQILPKEAAGEFLQKSVVLRSMSFFIRSIVSKDIVDLVRTINEELLNKSQMSHEMKMSNRNLDNIDTTRCIILTRIIDFLTILIKEYHINQFLDDSRDELLKVTTKLIFKPHKLGFDYKSKVTILQLPNRLTSFVDSIKTNAPTEFQAPLANRMRQKLVKYINEICQNCEVLLEQRSVTNANINKLKGIDLVLEHMDEFLSLDLLAQELLSKTAEVLLKKLFEGTAETKSGIQRPRHLSPSIKNFALSIIQLCFKIDVFLLKVFRFLFNDDMLKVSGSSSIRHGDHFMQIFKNQVFDLFTWMLKETIFLLVNELKDSGTSNENRLKIMSIITEINEHIFKHHCNNVELLKENVELMISNWPRIIKVALEMDNKLNCVDLALIDLLTNVVMTSPIEHIELGRKLDFQNWFFQLLENRSNSLELKSKAIVLLPCVTHREDKSNEKLMKALSKLQEHHMPLKSTEFPEGSLERAGLVAITSSLFQALLRSSSPVIYRFIINATITDVNYILESKLQNVQLKMMEALEAQEQEVILNQTFDAFLSGGLEPEIRLGLVSRFLLTIMKNCHVDVMISFIRQKINTICNLIESSLNVDTENAFVNRCGGYMIIEAFVASVPKEKIERDNFNYDGSVKTGVDMIKEFIKKMKGVRNDVIYIVDDPIKQELYRKFQCYCYRALAAMVSNTKDNPQLFNLTLFKETPEKRDFIWQKLIDVKNDNLYSNWTQDFQELPRLKEYIVSVKDLQTNATSSRRQYIETVSIFDRSLSQSLTKNDLSYSVVFSNRESLEREQQRREKEHQKTLTVTLESTPINDHEVMSVLVGVVTTIHQNKISPFNNIEKADTKAYEWVVSLATSMRNPANHKNVKLFLAKLIDNCRIILTPYAKQLMGAVLSVITDGCLGTTMNFFITDLVTMLLSWSHVYKPTQLSEKQDACALLKFLMENAYNDHSDIFKLNLELVKKVIETWSEILSEKLPTQTLLDLLQKPIEQEKNHQLRCGIQLNAVVLANDLVPWNTSEQRNFFIKAIINCFDNPNAQVYQAAAQLLGMCLRKVEENQIAGEADDNLEVLDKIFKTLERIQKKKADKQNDPNLFLQLLYGIQKEYPKILDPFMVTIKASIPWNVRKIKCIYLEMFLSRLEIEGELIHRELIAMGVRTLLKQSEYQLLALHIINKSLEFLKPNEVQDLLDDLAPLAASPRDDVRRILFEIMIFVFEKYQNDEGFDKKKPMRVILKGFTDTDTEIQNRVNNFLSVEGGLPMKHIERFLGLLENYYDPALEKEFLHYATQLLLDISIRHPRSKKPLLDYDPTKDREFFEFPISTKTSSQRSLPPMFIQSQQRQLLAGDGSVYEQLVRATQIGHDTRMFTPTQDPEKMTQVSQNFAFQQTQNSLFFSLKPQFLDKRSKVCSQSVQNEDDIETIIAMNKEGPKLDALDHLRKRFVRNDARSKSKEYALKAIDRRNFYAERQKEKLQNAREGREVVLYRRYRLGDLPDFFFNGLAILMPLQALSKRDDSIARDIFISIFQSIVAIVRESENYEEKEFFASVNNSIMSILKQTKNSDSFLLTSLMELAMKSETYLEIAPDILSNVATMNNMMVSGALFLESQLNRLMEKKNDDKDDEEEPQQKRLKIDVDTTIAKHWLKLNDLYYKMNEYEVVEGIFVEKLDLDPQTRSKLVSAIDFESDGSFFDASRIYQSLIVDKAERNESEKEFYYQSYFFCLANLSDWREITREIRAQFDSYDTVWDDEVPFHKETLLPHLLKSELRMILDEKRDDEFLNILEDWINDEKKCNYLREVFPEEIIMLHILEEKFSEGCVEAEKSLQVFGDEWSCLEMLDDKLKCLKESRNIAELSNFIKIKTSESPSFDKLYQSWKLSHPRASDSLVLWGDLLAYRHNFYNLINEENQGDSVRHLLEIKRKLLNTAFAQKNCDAARFLINDLKDDIKANRTSEKFVKCNLAIGKYDLMAADQKSTSSEEQIGKLFKGLNKLIKGVVKNEYSKNLPDVMIETFCCASEISWKLSKKFEQCKAEGIEISQEYSTTIMNLIDAMEDDDSELGDHLLRYSEKSLREARKLAQKFLKEEFSSEREIILAGAYLKMGQFCHQVYSSGVITSSEIQIKMMKSIFRAIAYGSKDAKVFLPYILQLPDLKTKESTIVFNQEINMVPEWMFISYISQILSNFDFEYESYLDVLLLKLATKYPNAIYFPFKLSRNHYQQMHENRGMEKLHVATIDLAISNPTIDKFMSSLECLVLPEKLLETHYQNFELFIDGKRKNMTNKLFQEGLQTLINEVFVKHRDIKGNGFSSIKDFQVKLQNLKKLSWDKQERAILDKMRALRVEITQKSNRRVSSYELHKLCSWLSEYKWSGDSNFIEIPGQYTGDSKPFIEQNVKIVRFDSQLKVFNSKQLPIELKIRGSDGKTYSFIVKYGEDLRQDQRIEQVLELMSRKLLLDKNCKQNHLTIQTYKVIPINSSCGIMSVVQNASTITEYLQVASQQFLQTSFLEFLPVVKEQFKSFLLNGEMFHNWPKTYENALIKRSRQELSKEMEDKEALIPKNILRRALMNSSLTLETYYILRRNLITSLASMNIAHWLFGIGDRHLSNILIDRKTGRLIGIDFGIAFGAAVNLSVPEIVPFRLTSHFVNVLEPMGVSGMIRKNMVHVLRCLRDHHQTILICLEMFVKEPTMDWLLRSKQKSIGNAESGVSLALDWNPESRISIFQRKLEGANPAKVLQDELAISQVATKANLLKVYMDLVRGENTSYRMEAKDAGLTPEEQVSCLIELATDKAILASVYLGWDPWV